MSRWTDLSNPSPTDDYVSPTSDVLLSEFQESQPGSYITWRARDFAGWPVLMAENVTAFEDADLIESATPEERIARELKTIFVNLSFPDKPSRSFIYIATRSSTPPYIPAEERFGPSLRQTRFYPDFFTIKKLTAYVMGRTSPSLLQPQQPPEILRDISISVHPQVVREAEEKSLTDDLETGIKLAQKIYSTLKRIDVNIEHDPEIVDRKTIRFTLTVSGEVDAILEDEALFKRHLRSDIDTRARELITVTYNREK